MPVRTSPLGQIARQLAARTDLWQPEVRFDENDRYYTRLLQETGYEAWLLTWLRENHDGPYWRHGSVRSDGPPRPCGI